MTTYIAALRRRKENGDAGFSLIELIVVVVILGVLAAIAVPVFMGLQGDAEQSAQDTVAANAASEVAADIAQGNDPDVSSFATDSISVAVSPETGATLENFCVTASGGADENSTSGPGC